MYVTGGRMVAFNNMSVTFGQLVASSLGAAFSTVPGESWRATVGIGAAPAILLACMLLWCPESPRQLVSHGKMAEADKVLLRLYLTSSEVQRQQKNGYHHGVLRGSNGKFSGQRKSHRRTRSDFHQPSNWPRCAHGLRGNGDQSAWRFQYSDVLFGDAVFNRRVQQCHRGSDYRQRDEFRFLAPQPRSSGRIRPQAPLDRYDTRHGDLYAYRSGLVQLYPDQIVDTGG
jgi:hypothetical protein